MWLVVPYWARWLHVKFMKTALVTFLMEGL